MAVGLVDVAGMILTVLIALAVYTFAGVGLVAFLRHVPVIGKQLIGIGNFIANRAIPDVTRWAEAIVRPLYDVFVLPVEKLGTWMDEAAVNLAALAWWAMHLNSIKADTKALHDVFSYASSLKFELEQSKARIQSLEASLGSLQQFAEQTLYRDVEQAINQSVGALTDRLRVDEQNLARGIDEVRNRASAAEQAAKQATNQLRNDIGSLTRSFNTALQNLSLQLNGKVGSLENDLRDYLQKNLGKLSTDITDAAATAATAADIGIAAKIAIDDFLENCGRKLCETFGQQANELQNMMNFVNEGEFLALIEAAVAHPEETAKLFADAFTGTFEELSALLRNMGK